MRADDDLGFDIQPNFPPTRFFIPDASFDVFSNELGCFDKNSLGQIKKSSEYVYFAGDSFTWGHADYDKKYTTVYEAKSGLRSVKCGVPHTGQRHQYEKWLRVVKAIGRYPKRVFVGYFENDPANDFAHPHSTVIDGFLVDVVKLKGKSLVKIDIDEVTNAIHEWGKNPNPASASPLRELLARYSITTHLIASAVVRLKYLAKIMMPGTSKSFYEVSRQFSFEESYSSSDLTIANREAIKKWANDAKMNSYELIFILIPSKDHFSDPNHYRSLKTFLRDNDISYYDLAEVFRHAKKRSSELYWGNDLHWSNEGNEFVGELLAKRFP